ncbi:MAG: sporulation peptidase YabG [Negativicutes bacterium]|nr:sporulation peptidase YabG [Negativicutes bacterium]
MALKVGDLVVRKSHGGDIIFKIVDIYREEGRDVAYLKGLHYRLVADAPLEDIQEIDAEYLRDEIKKMEAMHADTLRRVMSRRDLEREKNELYRGDAAKKYVPFDVPGKVLHLDGDEEYLRMCLKTYSQLHIEAVGEHIAEAKQPECVIDLLKKHQPDILVVTGHDALIGNGKKDFRDINSYRNSKYYIQSTLNARSVRPAKDDLVIFAGACQSYFEAILAAGANYASSPTRIFIHAYDPVFIAEKVAFTPINKTVDINEAITASVTGIEGVGGIETRGKFRYGMPKSPY